MSDAALALSSCQYKALQAGPHLLVFGALHGNEYAGAKGAARVIAALQANPALLSRGTLTLLPVANPAAYAVRTRYLNVNPNRIFKRHDQPEIYEEQLVTRLCDFIDACDFLLDIHTYVAPPSIPFVFADRLADVGFAEALGTPYVLTGWAELVGPAMDSTGYAHIQAKGALTLECGQQDDPAAVDMAESAIWRALLHLGMVDKPPLELVPAVQSNRLALHTRIVKTREGTLAAGLQHLQPVVTGQVLATYTDGEIITAAADGTIIMPKIDARLGDEWFYLADNNKGEHGNG